MPGELGKLHEVFARHDVNIAAQHYQTDGEIGYVVLDTDGVRTGAESAVLVLQLSFPRRRESRIIAPSN